MNGGIDRRAKWGGYVTGLDALRAIVVGQRFLSHATAHFKNAIGVDMFIALSGLFINRGLL